MDKKIAIGVDIGTTSISVAAVDVPAGRIMKCISKKSDADIVSEYVWEKQQDVKKIKNQAKQILDTLLDEYPETCAIGFTGQMHGILCLNKENRPVSNLYTWQDQRGGLGSPSSCEQIRQLTGFSLRPGYGIATYYDMKRKKTIPEGTACICTIMDYLAADFCGGDVLIHSSNAASLGLFDLENGDFNQNALHKLEIDRKILPKVTSKYEIVGYYRKVPVAVAIGDNQASFLGSVKDMRNTALVNFGTGSQISMMITGKLMKDVKVNEDIEIRPFLDNTFLLSGSALCGGRAYALLEQFFRNYAISCGLPDVQQYDVINQMALEGIEANEKLEVQTTFCGTRKNASIRGMISGIGESNFTPQHLCAGVLRGMVTELYDMFLKMPKDSVTQLVVSGNGVRRNPALCNCIEEIFGRKIQFPDMQEEAAVGAACFSCKR